VRSHYRAGHARAFFGRPSASKRSPPRRRARSPPGRLPRARRGPYRRILGRLFDAVIGEATERLARDRSAAALIGLGDAADGLVAAAAKHGRLFLAATPSPGAFALAPGAGGYVAAVVRWAAARRPVDVSVVDACGDAP
jgi:hypothetical protein